MAIDFNGLSPRANPGGNNRVEGTATAPAGKGQRAASGEETGRAADTLQLSPEAQALQKLEEQVSTLPDVNNERVAQLREAIDQGGYQVNAERIADRMLSLEEDLFG